MSKIYTMYTFKDDKLKKKKTNKLKNTPYEYKSKLHILPCFYKCKQNPLGLMTEHCKKENIVGLKNITSIDS